MTHEGVQHEVRRWTDVWVGKCEHCSKFGIVMSRARKVRVEWVEGGKKVDETLTEHTEWRCLECIWTPNIGYGEFKWIH